MKKESLHNFWYLLFAIAFIAAGHGFEWLGKHCHEGAVNAFEQSLHKKEGELDAALEKILSNPYVDDASLSLANIKFGLEGFERKGISIYLYLNDSLVVWSNNSIVPPTDFAKKQNALVKLPLGWYKLGFKKHKKFTVVGLLQLYRQYPYQNAYLKNGLAPGLDIIKEASIHPITSNKGELVKSNNGKALCKLELVDAQRTFPLYNTLSYIAFIIGVLLLLRFVYLECKLFSKTIQKSWPYAIFIFSLILIRFLTHYLEYPSTIYNTDLFGPRYFADSSSIWLSSLGDFLFNSLLFLYVGYFLYKKVKLKEESNSHLNLFVRILAGVLSYYLLLRFSWLINNLFVSLIRNSNIPFDINNLFALNTQSYIALTILGSIFFSFFLITATILRLIRTLGFKTWISISLFVAAFVVHISLCHLDGRRDLVAIMWGGAIIGTMLIADKKNFQRFTFGLSVILVFWFSLFSVHTFLKHNGLKEYDLRETYAEKLSEERDPVAVFLFAEAQENILKDTVLSNLLFSKPTDFSAIERRLRQQHLSGYWEKYNMGISLYDSLCFPIGNQQNLGVNSNAELDNSIEMLGEKTFTPNFYFLSLDNGHINYLARISLHRPQNENHSAKLYIQFTSGGSNETIGFPDLLLDKSVTQQAELKNYSYAKYRNGKLVSRSGSYAYPRTPEYLLVHRYDYFIAEKDGYSHLVLKSDEGNIVIVSKEARTFVTEITTFSYLFAFYSLLLLVLTAIAGKNIRIRAMQNISFKAKLQILLVGVVLVSLILFGVGTVYFVKKQFNKKSEQIISEKGHSVQLEIQNKLSNQNINSANFRDYSSYILKKFSNIFFTDITLYDLNGELIASSRPKLFESGLVSSRMNFDAYRAMAIKGGTEHIGEERVGDLSYLSAYLPFSSNGNVVGYINLPYFAKQNELQKEISAFLVALINIYVLLFALTVIIAVFFSNYLTKPLRIIQEKMSRLQLGGKNEFIEWNEDDEIGRLVNEYNKMIIELTKSAEKLAKSERETAWREMAKQVAHEIKNPLTPMKLSIQHLKYVWKNQGPDIDEKIESATNMLIEQIDTLSSIANEFSNFAKMPKANEAPVDVNNILGNVIQLYKDTVNISITNNCEENGTVLADKEQLLRVFNNLVKNAIQAIPENQEGKIGIITKLKGDNLIISISDNGSGINEHAIDKIFMPNFTTKSSGMGLGLAMVKNIIEQAKGKIWFETTKDKGTTFFISLPLLKS